MTHSENYKISMLEIKNFRQYRDVQIKFGCSPQKIFTTIRGSNGAGKTNIMNAITWCLYGTEKHFDEEEKDLPIINTKALKEKPNGLITMYVKIMLADNAGDKFSIERKLTLYNNGGINVINDKQTGLAIPEKSIPTIKRKFQWYTEAGWESTEYFDKSIKELLPEDLVKYFLFDGEKLEEFFNQVDDTKKGIEDVSQIKIIETTINTLTKFIIEIRKKAKNLNPQAEQYKQDMITTQKRFDDTKITIQKIKKDLETKKKKISDLEQLITKSGGDVGEYQKNAHVVLNTINQTQKDLTIIQADHQNYILEHMFGIQMLASIDQTLKYITTKTKKGELPPKIKFTFLNELLDRGICICGTDISTGTLSRAKVNKLLKSAQYSEINEISTQLKFELKDILKIKEVKYNLNKMEENIFENKDKIRQLKNEHDDLEAKIGSVDDDLIQKHQKTKISLQKDSDSLNKKLGIEENDQKNIKLELETAIRNFDKETARDDKQKKLTTQKIFCEKALSALEKIRNQLLDSMRSQVRVHTKKYFLNFLWKKNTYDDVNIDEEYKITAHHIDGYDVRTSLSKGEKLVLALSFMAALRKITGFGFPLIIDTPLGRVDGEPRYNIANLLPKFLKDNQVTLLVTDAEYRAPIEDDDKNQKFPSFRTTIKKYIGKEHDIEFVDNISRVIEH